MTGHEFFFSLDLSDERTFDPMLAQLARAVFAHVELSKGATDELSRLLDDAISNGAGAGHQRCDIRFVATAGELHIRVAFAGGKAWQTKRSLA